MSDIVERLRIRANDKFIRDYPLMAEAADEIERLTAYVEEWKRRYETARLAHEEGRAEIERLRALLKEHGIKRHTVSCSDAAEDDDL